MAVEAQPCKKFMTEQELYLVGGMMLATFIVRYPIFAFSSQIELLPQLIEALKYLPPAILTAIVVPAVLISNENRVWLNYNNAKLAGAIAAISISWQTKNLLAVIIGGMLAFLGWQWCLNVLSMSSG